MKFYKPYQLLLAIPVFMLVIWGVKVYASSLNISTYYPSPTGFYDYTTVTTGLRVPCHTQDNPNNVQNGWIWYVDAGPGCVNP